MSRADRTSRLDADREARRLAQTEFEAPLVLEAGAGTGKTATLVARVLAWSLGQGWNEAVAEAADGAAESPGAGRRERIAARVMDGIVAITFTEAAAAEMAERVAAGLAAIAADPEAEVIGFDPRLLPGPPPAPLLASRARALLGALDRLTVRTIHSYCRHLLVRYPLEAGLHPELTVDADGRLSEEIAREAVEAAARSAYSRRHGGPLVYLASRGIGPRAVGDALVEVIARGLDSRSLRANPFSADGCAAMAHRVRTAARRLLEAAAAGTSLPGKSKAAAVLAAAESTRDGLPAKGGGIEAAERILSDLEELWPDDLLRALRRWKKSDFGKAEEGAFGPACEAVAQAAGPLRNLLRHLLRIDARLLDSSRHALADLLRTAETEMRRRGVIGFAGLLAEARDLLHRNALVRARESARTRQLLVDEFQDTDRLQSDLVRLLALEGPAERRPGLFVVGDPKQSIYGWRNADLAAYDAFVAALLEAGGERRSLSENFRSAPPILTEVERVLAPTMRAEEGLQPAFEPLIPCAALAESPGFAAEPASAPIEHWISWTREEIEGTGPRTTIDEAAALEAEAVARDIARLNREAEVPWKEFALLFRTTSRLEIYLDALRAAAVPFVVTRDKHYYRRREIIDAAALVRTVVNPADHLALLAFLRSAAAGVPDAALVPLWRQQLPRLVTDLEGPSKRRLEAIRTAVRAAAAETPRVPGLSRLADWPDGLVAALEGLARARRSLREDPPHRFVDGLRERFQLEALEGSRYLGRFRAANLERFFRRLEGELEATGGNIQAILRALRRGVADAQEAEEALPIDAAENAVQVLTIHKAKGLEFGHVYLVQAHAETRRGESREIDVDERALPGDPAEYRLFGSPTPNFDAVERRRRRVAGAELVRTLYVALTRARERLVVAGRWLPEPAIEPGPPSTFLDLLACRDPAPPALSENAAAGRAAVDAAGARWRFPALELSESATETRLRPGSPLPFDRVQADVERLRGAQATASHRMSRLFQQAASASTGARLRRQIAGEAGDSYDASPRDAALAVGTVIHRMLETWRLDAGLEEELERQRSLLEPRLADLVGPRVLPAALERSAKLFERIAAGSLLRRFVSLSGQVAARELPVLLPPPSDDGEGPSGCVTGAVDLLLRDPASGSWTLVDFKTDEVESDEEIAERAAAYAPQESFYRTAVQEGFGLSGPPIFELWFLWPDRAWVSPSGAAAESE